MQKAMRISRYLRKYKNKDKIILIFKILFVPLQQIKININIKAPQL